MKILFLLLLLLRLLLLRLLLLCPLLLLFLLFLLLIRLLLLRLLRLRLLRLLRLLLLLLDRQLMHRTHRSPRLIVQPQYVTQHSLNKSAPRMESQRCLTEAVLMSFGSTVGLPETL